MEDSFIYKRARPLTLNDTEAYKLAFHDILKQKIDRKEPLVRYYSGVWTNAQKNYSTVEKEF